MKTALRLLWFLRPLAGEALLSILLGTATVACGIGLLGTSAYLIATAALHPSVADLQVAIVGVRFFGISRGVFRYLERLVSHSTNFRLLAELREWFYRQVEPLAPAGLADLQGGDLLNRAIGDIEALEDFYVRMVAPPVVALLVTLGTGWLVGRYALILGLLVTGGLVVGGLVLPGLVFVLSHPMGHTINLARSRLSAALVEGVQGMTEWTAYGQESVQIASILGAAREYEGSQARQSRLGAFGSAAGVFNQYAWVWGVVVAAVPLVRAGQLDGVSLAVVTLLTGAAFEAVLPLNQAALMLENTLQSARRLFEIADRPPAVHESVQAIAVPESFHLQVEHLSFVYPGSSQPALEDFSLDLAEGKRIALVGPSGAGKSTLVNLLLRFWEAPPGTMRIDGREIGSIQIASLRDRIAIIPQNVYLFSGSLEENVRLANPEATDEMVGAALRQAGLSGLVERLPGGLQGWVGAQGEQLSGGERQRVGVARAMLRPAELLMWDEPTANLDAISARKLLGELTQQIGRRSLLWITHDLVGLEEMDEIIVLREGRILERGRHAELLAAGGWYAGALALQRRLLI